MPALCWDTPKVGDLLPLEVANDRSPRGSSLAYVTENSCNCSFRNGWLAVFTASASALLHCGRCFPRWASSSGRFSLGVATRPPSLLFYQFSNSKEGKKAAFLITFSKQTNNPGAACSALSYTCTSKAPAGPGLCTRTR